ncbi:MAG TPA: hypothetical protein VMZ69_01385, partial [Saprospiraceae bacterium]|nr:hypothetical protein [Saprospiraceae bacterium]
MRILLSLSLCLLLGASYAQKLDHRLGYMILQVEKKELLPAIVNDYSGRFRSPVRIEKTLSKRMGIYLMAFDHGRIHEGELLS